MHRVGLIAPYDGIINIAREIANEQSLEFEMVFGELNDGVLKAREFSKRGINVIISRGGTAKVIDEEVSIEVVEIKMTGYNLLRSLKMTDGSNKKIGVIGYKNVIEGMRSIAEILDLEIEYIEIENEIQIDSKIQYARDLGVEIVLGDTLAARKATEKGLNSILIKSGREAIQNAIEEAIKLCSAIESEKIKKRRYKTIFESIVEGVIAIDKIGNVILFNSAARKIFNQNENDIIGKHIKRIIPESRIEEYLCNEIQENDSLEKFGKFDLVVNRMPVIIDGEISGVVATFRDITRILELEQKIRYEILNKGFHAKNNFDDIITNNESFIKTLNEAKEFARTDSTILIYGESGTGKEILSQSIHNESQRKEGPFVAINCAALPSDLLQSELFGYASGAFTGARKNGKKGLFELSHTGTIFLDEISEMGLDIQARILRVVQEKEIMRIGDDRIIPVDVRILAASNRDLWGLVQNNEFRRDLFYRINVLNIDLPSLSERKEDILLLSQIIIRKLCHKFNKNNITLSEKDNQLLLDYDWPGNIRELQNILERFVITSNLVLKKNFVVKNNYSIENEFFEGDLDQIERKVVMKIFEDTGYNKSLTAKKLGITRVTLNRIINV